MQMTAMQIATVNPIMATIANTEFKHTIKVLIIIIKYR